MSQPIIDLEHRVALLEAQMRQVLTAKPAQPTLPNVNIDDPKYGDPVVKFDPNNWKGASIKGSHMSVCPPEALKELARALDWFAEKNDKADKKASNGKPASMYDRLDAARARAWAERNAGKKESVYGYTDADEDLPQAFR